VAEEWRGRKSNVPPAGRTAEGRSAGSSEERGSREVSEGVGPGPIATSWCAGAAEGPTAPLAPSEPTVIGGRAENEASRGAEGDRAGFDRRHSQLLRL